MPVFSRKTRICFAVAPSDMVNPTGVKAPLQYVRTRMRKFGTGPRLTALDPLASILLAPPKVHKSLRMARQQQAKLWELRASVSLAPLRRDQGRHAEARELLAPVYRWFTEGFDTPDLKEATTLLDGLG
jgi:hypothetical protein